jgi:hypothetical protein
VGERSRCIIDVLCLNLPSRTVVNQEKISVSIVDVVTEISNHANPEKMSEPLRSVPTKFGITLWQFIL